LIDFYPILTSIMGAKFGIHPDAWAGSGVQPARPYQWTSIRDATRRDGRYHIIWQDETGNRRYATRRSLSDAKQLQPEKIAELERHREGRFNLDDREMLSQARDLASSHGYTVLQAIQEWHRWKGSSKAMPLGEVIEKFLAAKSNRSAAYTDKLNADLLLLQSHFGADRPIDRIRSNEIEDFLDSKRVTARRRNNLRSEIITLFRYAQIRLRALHRDRKTEAELVLRDQTKRKPVETFSPEEFQTFLGVVRPEWLPWLALGGLAGIRTDGEIFCDYRRYSAGVYRVREFGANN
jgi:hypothetical protein